MDDATELLQLDARRCGAMVAEDFAALDALFADDLTWTHSSAKQDTKASFLATLKGGAIRYLTMQCSDEQVHLHGAFAILTGVVEMRASINGKERDLRNRYTNVWTKSGNAWRMVAWQSTPVPR